jgi:hypothetical protein
VNLDDFDAVLDYCVKNRCTPDGGRACLLCGGEPDMANLFIPEDQRRIGAPARKTRVIIYLLCAACHRRGDCLERVEEKLLREAGVM